MDVTQLGIWPWILLPASCRTSNFFELLRNSGKAFISQEDSSKRWRFGKELLTFPLVLHDIRLLERTRYSRPSLDSSSTPLKLFDERSRKSKNGSVEIDLGIWPYNWLLLKSIFISDIPLSSSICPVRRLFLRSKVVSNCRLNNHVGAVPWSKLF